MRFIGLTLAWAFLETSICIVEFELKGPERFVIAKNASGEDYILGKGSAGKVFLGKDLITGHDVVLKYTFEDAYTSLKVERRVLQHLDHPRIPKVLDSYVDPQTNDSVLVQEYIVGKSINQKIKANEYPSAQAPFQIAQLLSIVHFLHQHGIAHMDIHGGNVIISDQGVVYLIDFGAALNEITGTAGIPGTSRKSYVFFDLDSRWRPTKSFGMAVDYYGIATIMNNIYLPEQVTSADMKRKRVTKRTPGSRILKDFTPLNPNPKPKSTHKYHAHLLTGMADVDEIIKILTNRNQAARWKDCFEDFEKLKKLPFFTNANVDWSLYEWDGKTVGELKKLSRQFELEDSPEDDSSGDELEPQSASASTTIETININPVPLSLSEAQTKAGPSPSDNVAELPADSGTDPIVVDRTQSIPLPVVFMAFLLITFAVRKRQI